MKLCGTSLLALSFASTAHAQPAPQDRPAADARQASQDDAPLENEIVVTAQRREQSLSDVGMAITAIGGEALVTRNVTQAEDLAKLVPGLSVSDSGFSTPIYTLRGVGINEPSVGSSSSVAVYVDEVPLAYPVITQGATIDLQRVEVLKGPQGTLYGQNSTGGAINYIANKPTNDFSAGVTGTFGRFSRGNVEGFVSGPIGPTLKARVAARAEFGDGWQRSMTSDDTLGRVERYVGRAIVEWEPTDVVKVTFNANGWIDKSDTIAPQLVAVTPAVPGNVSPELLAAPIPPSNARSTDWDRGFDFARDDNFYQLSARVDWDVTDQISLASITAYGDLDREQLADYDGVDGAVLRQFQQGTIKAFSQELRLAGEFGDVNVIVGANYTKDKTRENVIQNLPLSSQVRGLSTGGGIRANQDIETYAAFANVDVSLTDQWSVSGGIRVSEDKRDFQGCGYVLDTFSAPFYTSIINSRRAPLGLAPLPGPLVPGQCYAIYTSDAAAAFDEAGLPAGVPGLATRKLNESNVPWNLNVNFKPTPESLIYARVSRGYKSGNFASLNTLDLLAYEPIVQEKLTAYELGARTSIGRIAQLEIAGFWYQYDDKQLRARRVDPITGNINAQDNVPKSRLRGVEASAVVRPLAGLTVSMSGTYIDAKIQKYTGFTITSIPNFDFAGTPFNFTPKRSGNVDVNYEFPLSQALDGFVGVNYAYRSSTSSIFAPPGVPGLDIYDIRHFSQVDAQIGVRSPDGDWRLFLWGKNIFNQYYWNNVVKASDITAKYPGMPATYGVTASYKF